MIYNNFHLKTIGFKSLGCFNVLKMTFFLVLFFISNQSVKAQGSLTGKIFDEKGEPVYNAKVFNKNDKLKVVRSDFEGNYSIEIKSNQPQNILIAFIGYDTTSLIVNPLKNEVIEKNIVLQIEQLKVTTITEVSIVARRSKGNDEYMDKKKENSATTIDYISSETMKNTGDQNVSAATSRVSGVSSSGGIITVRGIGDRYVKTTLNGSRIPTLDPLTNNLKLDIFPASLVDNVIITKTASPDLPGDWSGAYLSVETKDYPNKLSVSCDFQFGYNAQTTFKDVISSQRSETDWLGFDNGLRNRAQESILSPNFNPTSYQELVALGLGDFYSNLGVNGWIDGSSQGETYFKLGLVELGLLPKGLINDPVAFNNAKAIYLNSYKPQAFDIMNPNGTNYNNGFSNSWNTTKRRAPLNISQSFSVGDQTKLFGKTLGYFVGFRYGSSVRYDPNGISQRIGAEELGFPVDFVDNAQISRETNGWSALVNLAYKLNTRNKFSFLFMPNFTGTNDVANFSTVFDNTASQEGRTQINQFYEQRKQMIYQVKSEHFVPVSKMKIDFNASYTVGSSIAPDFKVTQYDFLKEDGVITDYIFAPSAGDGIRRYYRYLDDNILDSRISAELPFGDSTKKLVRKLKFGGAYQRNDRKSNLNEFYLLDGNNFNKPELLKDDIDAFLSEDKFILTDRKVDFYYTERNFFRNNTFGNSSVLAGFVMLDYELLKRLRFSGGVRVEQGKIFSDVVEYYNKGYKNNDLRRENLGGFPLVNAANLNEVNILPSANFIYKLIDSDTTKINLRLNYSQTVARPSIRELNDAAIYDNEFRTLIYGNSDLKFVHIKNFDFRAESYFKNGDNFSVSLFYKDFRNHIELGFGSSGITWQNIDKSNVKGIEIDVNKTISKYFDLKANVTLVKSNSIFIRKDLQLVDGVKVYTPIDTVTRPMFGQAPYIVNAIVVFKLDSIGLTTTLSYNIQGPRLAITGVVKGRPDVYEIQRNSIDFKMSKTIGKYFTVSLTMRDLLNAKVRRAYKLPSGWQDFDSFRYGTNFIAGISYKL